MIVKSRLYIGQPIKNLLTIKSNHQVHGLEFQDM